MGHVWATSLQCGHYAAEAPLKSTGLVYENCLRPTHFNFHFNQGIKQAGRGHGAGHGDAVAAASLAERGTGNQALVAR